MLKLLFIPVIALIMFFFNPGDDEAIKYSNAIKSSNLMKTVEYLASDKLQGRMAGSPGYYLAADFAVNEFKKNGLSPLWESNYFQPFNVEYNEIYKASLTFIIDGKELNYKPGNDFVCRSFTGSGNIKSEVVFCGYGITDTKTGYDDYKDVNVKDIIVLVFKQDPSWKINDISIAGGYPRNKAANALNHGAAGIIFVSLPNDKNPQKPIASVLEGNSPHINMPMIHIELSLADKLFAGTGTTLKELQSKIDNSKTPSSIATGKTAAINIEAKYFPEKETVNIAAIYPGTDDKLKDEYIIIGAHIDHVGIQADEVIFPGANDNASGSAAVIEIAKTFANQKIHNKRSIIFVLFSSEEAGLLGAKHFVDKLPVPKDKIKAMFNFDCVGHGDSIQIGNGKSRPELWNMVMDIDKKTFKRTIQETWAGGGADAGPFHDAGIPALYFVTKFSYTYLHQPGDKPETLNPLLFEQITKLGFLSAYKLANE